MNVKAFSAVYLLSLCVTACSDKAVIPFDIKTYHGQWVVINYWASWCESCKLEIPQLNQFYEHHKNKVALIGVNYDHLQDKALKTAITQAHIAFPVIANDPANTLNLGAIDVVPMTFIFNPNGDLVKKLMGPQTETMLNTITSSSPQS